MGQGLLHYNREFGDYAPSPAELVGTGHATWQQFYAFLDPDLPSNEPPEVARHSSFVLQPGAGKWNPDPLLVLAYERSPRSPLELRIVRRCGRCVLFGDGTVRVLDDAAFREAKRADAAQRTQIGWFTLPADD
ncbi:MAG: hypothetical protein KKB50_03370 [Planctomycetes bacterium]|nr:hypothetical protein [Planctomycetota bacterium]